MVVEVGGRGPLGLHREHPAAGDGGRFRRTHERDRGGDLVGLDESFHGRPRQQDVRDHVADAQPVHRRLVHQLVLDQRGAHVPRAHAVAGDSPRCSLERDDLREPFETVLDTA
jgi:hypothetical protein